MFVKFFGFVFLFVALYSVVISQDYDYDDYDDDYYYDNSYEKKENLNKVGFGFGYAITVGEFEKVWDNGFILGLNFERKLNKDLSLGLNLSYSCYGTILEFVETLYQIENFPIKLFANYYLNDLMKEMGDFSPFVGMGLAYVPGRYDEIEILDNLPSGDIRRGMRVRTDETGFMVSPRFGVDAPFAESINIRFLLEYNYTVMNRDNREESLNYNTFGITIEAHYTF